MEYPAKPHSHIVPVGYLRAWASGERIQMTLVDSGEAREISLRDAAVRSDFYRRYRPATQEKIYDVEWSLGKAENQMIPAIRELESNWPPDEMARSKVGQFVAMQHMRGTNFRKWTLERTRELGAETRSSATDFAELSDQEFEATMEWMEHSTTLNAKMLKYIRVMSVGLPRL